MLFNHYISFSTSVTVSNASISWPIFLSLGLFYKCRRQTDMHRYIKWLYKHTLLKFVIFFVLNSSLSVSSHTHTHTHTHTGWRSGVCMRWQSALSVRSSAPTGPPDGRGVGTTPLTCMKYPFILQPPARSPCNTLHNYKSSERCLV